MGSSVLDMLGPLEILDRVGPAAYGLFLRHRIQDTFSTWSQVFRLGIHTFFYYLKGE